VLAHERPAIFLERAQGTASLAAFARNGRDDDATRIICAVVAKLHAPRSKPLPDLIPLSQWFRELDPAAAAHEGILPACAAAARELLASPREVGVLHGDIHHDNILDFGERGWLAIDPKRLLGERGFDYANLFCNPDLSDPAHPVATIPGRFARRVEIVAEAAGLERKRLLQWILAWAGLSAAWFLGDGVSPETDFRVAELAAAELGR
jgi:streptomycin 6-kinase